MAIEVQLDPDAPVASHAPPGRVVQVNVSSSGVPKQPLASARVDRLGLEGDGHTGPEHGGADRAVTLFALEAIRRVRAEGHPIGPGSVGENLTTGGLEISLLAPGTRLAVGEAVVLELTRAPLPCRTIRHSFDRGRIGRISIEVHPSDSRMCARVLAGGVVRPGDPIRVLPPDGLR